ncbi:MAG: PorT family protein, partial [Bacteroidaceae bacterium]|nr:PorT family protein [Bacteroidaceae bacterium]
MKTRIFHLLFLASIPLALSAQVGKYRSDLAIGASGGILMNNVTFSPRIQQTMYMGTEFGLSLRYTCEKYFATVCAVQTEINFSRQGWNEEVENGTYSYRRNMNYIHIPFMARLGFGRERKGAMGYIILGPQIGFCVSASDTRKGEWTHDGTP